MAEQNYLLVCAIDFGTTFSGYAFSFRNDPNSIIMNKNWGSESGFQAYKTPTSVLLGPDGKLHSFGYQAESEFTEMEEGEIQRGYQLFKRFKMELFHQKDLNSKSLVTSTSGKKHPAVDEIAEALAYLKSHCLEAINKSTTGGMSNDYVRWVITVPAIWTDTAKKMMRLAAKQAGLVKDLMSPNLVIALEPEAASLYCRSLDTEGFIGDDNANRNATLNLGDRYIVVDCGGGTLDITVHKVLANRRIAEILAASGGPWGGICVDKNYCHLVEEIFGADFINKLKQKNPSTWLGMEVDFESKKRAAAPDKNATTNISISFQLAGEFESYSKVKFQDQLKSKKQLGIGFANGLLRIDKDKMASFYHDCLQNISDHLRTLLQQTGTVSCMFVVGGFGESAYVQHKIMTEFGRATKVLVPEEASMCVAKGAVLFGHDPALIASRVARYNYNFYYLREPERNDDPSRIKYFDGIGRRFQHLERIVKKGDVLKMNESVERTSYPDTATQVERTLKLYCTDVHTEDPNHPTARMLETLVVYSPVNGRGQDRPLRSIVTFGGSDISFRAIDLTSGNSATTTIRF